ncbi:LINE-1 retrotransposable element ORF2 protein [Linum grandiflorum]
MASSLTAPVGVEEIRNAVFSIGPTHAPGPDGFTGLFFQRFWPIVGGDVTSGILDFFRSDSLLRSLNHTWMTLIPKVLGADSMRQLRPIGLCTVFYKTISKIITTRLGNILPNIVSSNQNGFIRHRSITDNVLLAHELMHYLKLHASGKRDYMALKVDMEKAYDRVEWGFLFQLLTCLGFPNLWISLICECLSSATIFVLVNGSLYGFFSPSRGLRQGDPLSPLLFALCSEGLTRLIEGHLQRKSLHGIRINRRALEISHLMFADDTILFLRVSPESIQILSTLFQRYEALSGQRINLTKSTVRFSSNVSEELQLAYSELLGTPLAEDSDRYLGLPSISFNLRLGHSVSLRNKFPDGSTHGSEIVYPLLGFITSSGQ